MDAALCTGSGWHQGRLQLELRAADDQKLLWPLDRGRRFAVRVGSERRCIGRRPPDSDSLLPCPDDVVGIGSSQCENCFAASKILPCLRCSGERCRNPARRGSCVQPANHALYLCSFGPGAFKVGVARWNRRLQRVSEQGARAGIVVARDDGQMIRRYERMISRTGIADRLQPVEKLGYLSVPADTESLAAELLRLRAALARRLPLLPWSSEVERLDLPALPSLPITPALSQIEPEMSFAGVIHAQLGSLLIVDSELGEMVAIDIGSLVGHELTQLARTESGAGQLALALA